MILSSLSLVGEDELIWLVWLGYEGYSYICSCISWYEFWHVFLATLIEAVTSYYCSVLEHYLINLQVLVR